MTPDDITKLIVRTALRDRGAFDLLYRHTSAKLFGVCLRVLNDRAEAEEALQEVFVKIWMKADRFAVCDLSPITWLVAIARQLQAELAVNRPFNCGSLSTPFFDITAGLRVLSEVSTPHDGGRGGRLIVCSDVRLRADEPAGSRTLRDCLHAALRQQAASAARSARAAKWRTGSRQVVLRDFNARGT